jgi:hypothetical protein
VWPPIAPMSALMAVRVTRISIKSRLMEPN